MKETLPVIEESSGAWGIGYVCGWPTNAALNCQGATVEESAGTILPPRNFNVLLSPYSKDSSGLYSSGPVAQYISHMGLSIFTLTGLILSL